VLVNIEADIVGSEAFKRHATPCWHFRFAVVLVVMAPKQQIIFAALLALAYTTLTRK